MVPLLNHYGASTAPTIPILFPATANYGEIRLNRNIMFYQGDSASGILEFTLRESYTFKGRNSSTIVGKWRRREGLADYESNFFARRTNLLSRTLLTTAVSSMFLSKLRYVCGLDRREMFELRTRFSFRLDPETKNIVRATGLLHDLLDEMGSTLNFTWRARLSVDGKWGKRVAGGNGSFNGMVGMLQS